MLLYLSCPDLKPGEADASLRELSIERRHVSFDQLLIEGPLCDYITTHVAFSKVSK